MKERIFLIGYMGSGKTTLGKLLAEKLGYLHIDTDEAISNLLGLSISEIFETQGESSFRTLEHSLTKFLLQLENIVVSTGGGLPIYNGLLDKINQAGTSIYLQCPIEELAKRISKNEVSRPLHKSSDIPQLLKDIQKRFNEREATYLQADITINSNNESKLIIDLILERLSLHEEF